MNKEITIICPKCKENKFYRPLGGEYKYVCCNCKFKVAKTRKRGFYGQIGKEFAEYINFALTRWDMNPMTKYFAKELSKQLALITEKYYQKI